MSVSPASASRSPRASRSSEAGAAGARTARLLRVLGRAVFRPCAVAFSCPARACQRCRQSEQRRRRMRSSRMMAAAIAVVGGAGRFGAGWSGDRAVATDAGAQGRPARPCGRDQCRRRTRDRGRRLLLHGPRRAGAAARGLHHRADLAGIPQRPASGHARQDRDHLFRMGGRRAIRRSWCRGG